MVERRLKAALRIHAHTWWVGVCVHQCSPDSYQQQRSTGESEECWEQGMVGGGRGGFEGSAYLTLSEL